MFRQMRSARAVHLALSIAALLAIGGSFGLHPEPGAGAGTPSAGGISTVKDVASPHGCLACLTHGVALVSPLAGIIPDGAASTPSSLVFELDPSGRLSGRNHSGRSPPARS
jgi:hypothetical protein